MTQIHNFSPGPAVLPKAAIEESIEGLRNFKNTGLSVVEISHRTPAWEETMDEARAIIRHLYSIPDEYEVLFLHGGASLQFCMIPFNLLDARGTAAYLESGHWAALAAKEAKLFGDTRIVATSKDKNYNFIPKGYDIPSEAAYFHITTNNTIYGTQLHEDLKSPIPMVADMSSDIFSRPIDISRYAMIYAGAQKNMGPAGTTLVIIRKDILGKVERQIPSMLDYRTHIKGESMFNTPSVFAIYLSYCTLKWLKNLGGCGEIAKINQRKAALLYAEIDRNNLFEGTTEVEDRSLMNITFVAKDNRNDDAFLQFAKANGVVGLKGHRSVGGFRASTYNALPEESVAVLVDLMKDFERTHG